MFEYVAVGTSLALAAAIQPGPTQAYMFSRVAAIGWKRTLPAALAPVISDGPIAILALLVLGQLSLALQSVLRIAGGLLLLYFAWRALAQWRNRNPVTQDQSKKTPRTLWEAAAVNALNPNPYLGWALILGPVVLEAWRKAPGFGIGVVAAFYVTMVVAQGALIFVFGSTTYLGPEFRRNLLFVSGVILALLGFYQLIIGIGYFVVPTK